MKARARCGVLLAPLAGALLLLAPSVSEAVTYHVATTGNNTNSGLSAASAFATLQRAANVVIPGDAILMHPGNYLGARLERSGSSNAPIMLSPASPGTVRLTAPGPNNLRNSTLEIETWGAPFVVRHWVVRGLRVVGSPKYGIDARSTQFLRIEGNTVSNSVVTGIFTPFCYDLEIVGNTSTHNGEHGIYHNNSSDRFVIRENVLHHNTHAGLHMNADLSVAPPAGTPWGWDGIMSDGIVEANIIYLNGKGGAGINMDGIERTLVRNNRIFNSTNNSGIAIFQGNGAIASRQNRIINNTIIMGANGGGWAINLAHSNCINNTLLNNVTYNFHSFRGSISLAVPNLIGFTSDYNTVMSRFSVDDGGNRITLAAWQALGYDLHSFVATPASLLVDPAGDLRLLSNSAAIDRGIAVADVPVDAWGAARPLDGNHDGTNKWDIGAHERAHPQSDSDADGFPDIAELSAGTDATNAASRLELTAIDVQNAASIAWLSVAGKEYALEFATNQPTDFTALASNIPATPPVNVHTAAVPDASASFFRVGVEAAAGP